MQSCSTTCSNHSGVVELGRPLEIGSLRARNRVFLAPMSGVSDAAFRKMAWKLGAGLVFSEMVASEALVSGSHEMKLKARSAGLPIHAVQIAGREAKWMALAAKMAEENGANLIDINMGCPARRVTSGLSGSALMRDLDHAMTLIDAVVDAVSVPVSLKMRLGWDDYSINAPQLAVRAQNAGICMVTVHGRTRCQFYKGNADWSLVGEVKQEISIPLIVNGDITNRDKAHDALQKSSADGVMVGRASYGAPWAMGQIANASSNRLSADQVGIIVLEHFEGSLSQFGRELGVRHFRKHLGWYLDSISSLNKCTRLKLMRSEDPNHLVELIKHVFCSSEQILAA